MSNVVVIQGGGSAGGLGGGGQAGGCAGNDLVSQVARITGNEDEDNVRTQALDCANRAVHEVNMHDWRFLKKSVASTAFTASTPTYTLGGTFKAPAYFRVLDSAGKQYRDLRYEDDGTITHWLTQQTAGGVPVMYSLRNTFGDGLVTFYPVPDAATVSSYTWSGEFYTRLADITDDAAVLSTIPDEICNVIVLGGQAYLMRERDKSSPMNATAFADYQRVKNLALVNDRRMTDDNPRFRLQRRRSIATDANSIYGWF